LVEAIASLPDYGDGTLPWQERRTHRKLKARGKNDGLY
jgi:hypothetical protein